MGCPFPWLTEGRGFILLPQCHTVSVTSLAREKVQIWSTVSTEWILLLHHHKVKNLKLSHCKSGSMCLLSFDPRNKSVRNNFICRWVTWGLAVSCLRFYRWREKNQGSDKDPSEFEVSKSLPPTMILQLVCGQEYLHANVLWVCPWGFLEMSMCTGQFDTDTWALHPLGRTGWPCALCPSRCAMCGRPVSLWSSQLEVWC